MTALQKTAVNVKHLLANVTYPKQEMNTLCRNLIGMVYLRNLSTARLTNNVSFITNDSIKISNYKIEDPDNKPLVVMMSWLMARDKHVNKFANIYVDQGFNVLHIKTLPRQLLWPEIRGSKVVAKDVARFIYSNAGTSPVIVHGFSVGAFMWAEIIRELEKEPEKFKMLLNRIVGQVWDSATEVEEIVEGVPRAMFPRSKIIQYLLKQYMMMHLKVFHDTATVHYRKASEIIHSSIYQCPTVMFVSKVDLVGTEQANKVLMKSFQKKGIDVNWKCWDDSPHVGHYRKYPQEYVTELYKLLNKINLVSNPEKIQKLM